MRQVRLASSRTMEQLVVGCDIAGDGKVEAEVLPDEFRSMRAHCACAIAVVEQVDNAGSQEARRVRRNEQAAPAVTNDVATTGHLGGYDRQSCKRSLHQD